MLSAQQQTESILKASETRGHMATLQQRALSALHNNIAYREILLLEYYARLDHNQFLKAYTSANEIHQNAIGQLKRSTFLNEYIAEFVFVENDFTIFATELGQTLASPTIDWDRARELLPRISSARKTMQTRVSELAQQVNEKILDADTLIRKSTRHLQLTLQIVILAIFGLALMGTYIIFKLLKDQSKNKALALFSDRNPNPILRIRFDGQVDYANAGTQVLLNTLFPTDNAEANALLPRDLQNRLDIILRGLSSSAVWEYQLKDRYLECTVQYQHEMECFYVYITDITQRKNSESELLYQVQHDSLTTLPNRRMFQKWIEYYVQESSIDGERTALLLLSLDRFHAITGSLGPGLGDTLLSEVAARLQTELEKSKSICEQCSLYRLENAVFAILIHGFDNRSTVSRIANRLITNMQNPVYIDTREYFTTISIGISIYPVDGTDTVTLLRNANSAMTRAINRNGNTECFYSLDMNGTTPENLSLENYLRHAISHDELELFYQPQISTLTKQVSGMEAVLRWNHPERGLIMPDEIIPLAEETGMIVPIGEWILHKACNQASTWQSQGLTDIRLAVNISSRQFNQKSLQRLISRILQSSGLKPEKLELEITESIAMQDSEETENTLLKLKELGVKISLDDFGTGWSSLTYLKKFPIDKMKVDQSFVHNLSTNIYDRAICRALITLSHSLDITVLAEGVENDKQLAWLETEGCDQVQGYYFSKPLPANEFVEYVQRQNASACATTPSE